MVDEHCILLALPCGRDQFDVLQQSSNLKQGFITYLQSKQAAGIININVPGSQQVIITNICLEQSFINNFFFQLCIFNSPLMSFIYFQLVIFPTRIWLELHPIYFTVFKAFHTLWLSSPLFN